MANTGSAASGRRPKTIKRPPPRVVGDAKRWKALSHPIRQQILAYLDQHGAANSTALAEALGESTGTTSYHLRVLAGGGVIEPVAERSTGRERWWRPIPTDLREPDYDSLSPAEKRALDEWRRGQYPLELQLVERFIREHRDHHGWARAFRAELYFTREDLDAFAEDYIGLLHRYGYTRDEAPPGARAVQLRMFYIPTPS